MLKIAVNEVGNSIVRPDGGRLNRAVSVLLALIAATLTACAHVPGPAVAPAAPVRQIDPETWRQVDRQIVIASGRARSAAEAYARVAMEEWQGLVRKQTEEVFIPWYLNYWTQQWISARAAWYELQHSEGEKTSAEQRLVSYLQEQFYEQVLIPVSGFINPRTVMEETFSDYLHALEDGIDWLPVEHNIPLTAFNQHLDAIPAIHIQTLPPQHASLFEVLEAADLSDLVAYGALLRRVELVNNGAGQAPSADRLQSLARQAVTQLAEDMPLRGGAIAASGLVGGPLGAMISAGATAWSVMEHDRDRPAIEAQLRASLEAAFDVLWQELVEDSEVGVMAPVNHLNIQIGQALVSSAPNLPVPQADEPATLF